MTATVLQLEELIQIEPQFLQKGGLCVGLVISSKAKDLTFPIDPESLLAKRGAQVAGLSGAAVKKILAKYGIFKVLAKEGGRTSRGTPELMKTYVRVLNALHSEHGAVDFDVVLDWWIVKVRLYFASEGPTFHFDSGKSVAANLADLFGQALDIQRNSGGANYVGAMLQHLVGAKLDLVLGQDVVKHHGFSVADEQTARQGDFEVNGVAIHITTHPSEALIQKAATNISQGLRPLIITLGLGVQGATYLLKETEWKDRVDVLDVAQFLTANVYERSLFQTNECKTTLRGILERYNEIVAECETDPVLTVRFD